MLFPLLLPTGAHLPDASLVTVAACRLVSRIINLLSNTHEPWELKNTSRTDNQRHTDDSSELCHSYWQSVRTVTLYQCRFATTWPGYTHHKSLSSIPDVGTHLHTSKLQRTPSDKHPNFLYNKITTYEFRHQVLRPSRMYTILNREEGSSTFHRTPGLTPRSTRCLHTLHSTNLHFRAVSRVTFACMKRYGTLYATC